MCKWENKKCINNSPKIKLSKINLKSSIMRYPTIDNMEHKGSDETDGNIKYNYQKIKVWYTYFLKKKELIKSYKIPLLGTHGWYPLIVENKDIYIDPNRSISKINIIKSIKYNIEQSNGKTNTRFNILFIAVVNSVGNHANGLIFDSKLKKVYHYETNTRYNDIVETLETIRGFINSNFPDYTYTHIKGFQAEYDAFNGMCVTWVILFTYLVLTNPNMEIKKLRKKLYEYIDTNKLLRFAKYVMKTIKSATHPNSVLPPRKTARFFEK